MSSVIKAKLKVSREAINNKDWKTAQRTAEDVLSYDAANYNGNVFLGLASFELNEIDKSEQAYRKAIDIQPDQLLAWRGIEKIQEKTERWDDLDETLEKEIEIASNSGDATKVAEFLQKLIEVRREHGSALEVTNALSLLLPESRLYDVLSTIPPLEPTAPTKTTIYDIQAAMGNSLPVLEEIVAVVERSEEEAYTKEVERRRTRINAGTQQEVQNEVGRDIWGASKLPALYEDILNHPNTSDQLRRDTESKLLRHRQRYLYALPTNSEYASEKNAAYKVVEDMASGAVLLGLPDELAWSCYMENLDVYDIEGYDFGVFRRFSKLFRGKPLATLLTAYLNYLNIPLDDDESETAVSETVVAQEQDSSYDPVETILTNLAKLPKSIIAHRIVGDVYTADGDHKNAIRIAEAGINLVKRAENNTGKKLPLVRKAFDVILATGLVHLYPPKHHARASRILEEVLARNPGHVGALMARAYIYQYAKNWGDAVKHFQRVMKETDGDDTVGWVGVRAREEVAWCMAMDGQLETSLSELREVSSALALGDAPPDDRARVEWRLGKCLWDIGGERRDESYKRFIGALKFNPSYASAFTSLGSAKACRGFAEEREWDLVEVVARRTIEGEGGLTGGLDKPSTEVARHQPTFAWAWKAIGLVEMNRHNYAPAIQSFQVALRANEEGAGHCPSNEWIAAYIVGTVQRDMGLHLEAVDTFNKILADHPGLEDPMIIIGLGKAYLELGCLEAQTGYSIRAEISWCSSLDYAFQLISEPIMQVARRVGWRLAYDALTELGKKRVFLNVPAVQGALAPLAESLVARAKDFERHLGDAFLVSEIVDSLLGVPSGGTALKMAAAVSAYLVTLSTDNEDSLANSWAGLAIATFNARPFENAIEQRKKLESVAIVAVKHALRRDPSNDQLWSLYGSLSFADDPKISQHAFIKAIEIDGKEADHWARLGLLYLNNDDVELAQHVFVRSQILDPDASLAWVGKSLLAVRNQKHAEAQTLLEHAIGLASYSPRADKEYGIKCFVHTANTSTVETLFPAFFALQRYCQHFSDDSSGLHLLALVAERLGLISLATDLLMQAIPILETLYEATEDAHIAEHYGIAKVNLGRLQLAEGDYSAALDAFNTALALLPESTEDDTIKTCRAHAQASSGIAHYMLDDFEAAVGMFEAAEASAPVSTHVRENVTISLCQALWEVGSEDAKEAAKSQLLEMVEQDPSNLECIVMLVAIGTLNNEPDLVDAALSEILGMPTEKRQVLDPGHQVDRILVQHHIAQGNLDQALKVVRNAVALKSATTSSTRALLEFLVQTGDDKAVEVAISALKNISERNALSPLLRIAGVASAKVGKLEPSVQKGLEKAVMLAPWDERNYLALTYTEPTSSIIWLEDEGHYRPADVSVILSSDKAHLGFFQQLKCHVMITGYVEQIEEGEEVPSYPNSVPDLVIRAFLIQSVPNIDIRAWRESVQAREELLEYAQQLGYSNG
ncbi:Tetratricopeptide repeat [Rhizoctonia solani]|uniref:Tetratricopeptide repeat n=1 Tax=Rhizoctonia solani TaxID=456999 RepID=A0A8H7IF10_9AGAM|nr:Tetratricopeptide repeat [Rhizoctonia solani]